MRILLAIDDTQSSEAATRMVIAQNKPGEAQVRIVHVVDTMTNHIPEVEAYYPGIEYSRDAQLQHARGLVEKASDLLSSQGLQVTTVIKWGSPKAKILEAAEEWSADLIVLGSHHKEGVGRFLTAGVSNSVIRHATCSVEIARFRSEH
jgi:nucleotide-binding universal stress UspA family protein